MGLGSREGLWMRMVLPGVVQRFDPLCKLPGAEQVAVCQQPLGSRLPILAAIG